MVVEEGAVFTGHISVGPEAAKKGDVAPGAARPTNGPIVPPPTPAGMNR